MRKDNQGTRENMEKEQVILLLEFTTVLSFFATLLSGIISGFNGKWVMLASTATLSVGALTTRYLRWRWKRPLGFW